MQECPHCCVVVNVREAAQIAAQIAARKIVGEREGELDAKVRGDNQANSTMSFDPQIPGCFSPSLFFASHPLDEARAFQWLISLRDRGIGWQEAQGQIRNFLLSKISDPGHINLQLTKASRYLKPWLLD